MCCFPLPLCSVVLSLSHAPSPPPLPGCPGDSERHFFPEAPLSPMALFSLLCWLAHQWRRNGGGRSPKTSTSHWWKAVEPGGILEMNWGVFGTGTTLNHLDLCEEKMMQWSCCCSRGPSFSVWVGIVWSSLSWWGGGVCYNSDHNSWPVQWETKCRQLKINTFSFLSWSEFSLSSTILSNQITWSPSDWLL